MKEKEKPDTSELNNSMVFAFSFRMACLLQVRLVQDAEERLKRETNTAKRSASASKLPTSKDQARIKEQMDADRLERASRAS